MQAWDDIVNTAMIGTDKKHPATSSLPASLEEIATQIATANEKDKEEQFLQLASVLFNYQRCGISSLKKDINIKTAPAEEKAYCNTPAVLALKDILNGNNLHLLEYWLEHCNSKNQIVTPDFIPALLNTGEQQKKLRILITSCCGKRGEWLSGFNPAWNFSTLQTPEEIWQTGSLEERKEILHQTFQTDPVKAREWIKQTWAQEDAATKLVLLTLMSPFANSSDIEFLEGLVKEKSKKIQGASTELLKEIPGSPVVIMYENLLRSAVSIQKESNMLGLSKKSSLQFKLPEQISEDLYKTGIDKLSSDKSWTDDEYVLYQLIKNTPPSFWEEHLQLQSEAILEIFQKNDTGKKLLPALLTATANFRDARWASVIAENKTGFEKELLALLPVHQRDAYINHFFARNINEVIEYASETEETWSLALARLILKEAALKPYSYMGFFQKVISQIPVAISTELSSYPVSEEQYAKTLWTNMSEQISRSLSIKIQINKAFTI
jgi:hypothetical protein